MTLIAFVCKGDHAELVTDSLAYTHNLGKLSANSKFMLLHHLNAVVLTQGDGLFGDETKSLLRASTPLLPEQSFDALVAKAPGTLRDLWAAMGESRDNTTVSPPAVFLIGLSAAAREYRAYQLAVEDDFTATPVEGLFVTPMCSNYRASALEAARLREGDYATQLSNPDAFFDDWMAKPERPVPDRAEDWVQVAFEARSRALQDFMKHLVGGAVYYTELRKDQFSTIKLFDFDDTGDDLLKLVGYSQHPASQERPCWCDSGKRHIDCHLAPYLDETCGCGSSQTFHECCAVTSVTDGIGA